MTVIGLGLHLGQQARADEVGQVGPDVPADQRRDCKNDQAEYSGAGRVPDSGGDCREYDYQCGLWRGRLVGLDFLVDIGLELARAQDAIPEFSHAGECIIGKVAWFSFHGGHSGEFCRHANGSLAEVLESACERGFNVYGVSEHAPRLRHKDLYPDEQDLTPADLARIFSAYIDRARVLQGELEGRLEVLVGFETEMVPPEGWLEGMNELRRAPFDYTIGSVHHVGDMPIDMTEERTLHAAEQVGGMSALHCAYFKQLAEMVSEFRPTVVGHFDLIRKFSGGNPSFDERTWLEIERALEAVRESGALLDVNAAPRVGAWAPPTRWERFSNERDSWMSASRSATTATARQTSASAWTLA